MTDLERGPSSDGESAICASSLNKPSSQEGLKPDAWRYTLHMEHGQKSVCLRSCRGDPFGIPGEDRSAEYTVTEEPLYTRHPSFNDAIEAAARIADMHASSQEERDADSNVQFHDGRDFACESIAKAIRSLAPHISPFRTGDRVKHVGRDEDGTVTILENGNVQVLFDNPNSRGRPSIGVYDANWFKMYPNGLRSLKLPDYRGGEAKTAECNHSPSTLNAETE